MARVLIHVADNGFAERLTQILENGDFSVTCVEKSELVLQEFNRTAANLVLLEVTGKVPFRMEERRNLWKKMRQLDPECKVVLLVNEQENPEAAAMVRQAKRDNLIHQFLYTSVSGSYLLGVLETVT